MGARRHDRRVQRTQQLLRAALLPLIEEKGFEALTVQDIIDERTSAVRPSTRISTTRKTFS
jgi:AcrR family transcriptional regulator